MYYSNFHWKREKSATEQIEKYSKNFSLFQLSNQKEAKESFCFWSPVALHSCVV